MLNRFRHDNDIEMFIRQTSVRQVVTDPKIGDVSVKFAQLSMLRLTSTPVTGTFCLFQRQFPQPKSAMAIPEWYCSATARVR